RGTRPGREKRMPDIAAVLSDRYRIAGGLGAGGMAAVYLAHDLRHRRDVAIDEAFALESAKERDGIGHMWVRFPDIEPILAHPRYPEILAGLGADVAAYRNR